MNYFSHIRVTNALPRFVARMDKARIDIIVFSGFHMQEGSSVSGFSSLGSPLLYLVSS